MPLASAPVLATLLALAPAPAPGPDAPRPTPTAEVTAPARVVLVVFGDDALAEAITPSVRAQLADVPAELVVRRAQDPGVGVGARLFPAAEAATGAEAMAAFWVEVSASGDLLLHLVERSGARFLTRRIPRTEEGEAASHAAVATIVRAATAGLLAGEEIGLTPVEPEPPMEAERPAPAPVVRPSPAPTPAPVRERRLFARLSAAYRGGPHAKELGGSWHGGLQVDAGLQHGRGGFVVVGYTLLPPLSGVVEPPTQEGLALIQVQRHPLGLTAGWQWWRQGLALEASVRGELEIQRASISSQALFRDAQPGPETGLEGSLEPQLRFIVRPTRAFGVFFGTGVSFFFARNPPPGVDWVDDTTGQVVHRTVYLHAHPVRPVFRIGVLAWL